MYPCCQGLLLTDLTKLDNWTSFYILSILKVSAAEDSSIYAVKPATGCSTAGLTAHSISIVDAAIVSKTTYLERPRLLLQDRLLEKVSCLIFFSVKRQDISHLRFVPVTKQCESLSGSTTFGECRYVHCAPSAGRALYFIVASLQRLSAGPFAERPTATGLSG